ncbi:MAG: hypothetical protein U0Q12_04230 [Vicinamibacterales bacterium]
MAAKSLTIAGVAFGCVVAAGVGGYVATRSLNATPAPSAAVVSTAADASPTVLESEGVLAPSAPATPSAAPDPAIADASSGTKRGAARPAEKPGDRRSEPAASTTPDRRPEPARPSVVPGVPRTGASPSDASPSAARQEDVRSESGRADSSRTEPGFSPMPSAPESRPVPVEPEKTFEELVVSRDSVIGLQVENTLSSERARIEDGVEARVTRDVKVGGSVAIPAGSRMRGSVTLVDRGGKVSERAKLGVRFHTLVLADGTQIPIQTETIYREGESPRGESSAKIGGAAVGGAILGAILGGAKGAAIGGSVGAAGGTAAVMAGGRNPAELKAGSTVTVRLSDPVSVTVEKPDQEQQR